MALTELNPLGCRKWSCEQDFEGCVPCLPGPVSLPAAAGPYDRRTQPPEWREWDIKLGAEIADFVLRQFMRPG
jgi:hypothetical protein